VDIPADRRHEHDIYHTERGIQHELPYRSTWFFPARFESRDTGVVLETGRRRVPQVCSMTLYSWWRKLLTMISLSAASATMQNVLWYGLLGLRLEVL
jgi:hypothetical protein